MEISLENFVNTLKLYRHHYPDIIEPLLSNVTELLYGIKLKISIRKKPAQINERIVDLVRFPNLNAKHMDCKSVVEDYLSKEMQSYVKDVLDSEESDLQANKYNYRYPQLTSAKTPFVDTQNISGCFYVVYKRFTTAASSIPNIP